MTDFDDYSDDYTDDSDLGAFGVDDTAIQPVDPLHAAYLQNPAEVTMAVAQQQAALVASEALQRAQEIANQRNAHVVTLEVMRDIQSRVPDFEQLRGRVAARLEADPALTEGLQEDPAAVARRIEDQFKIARDEAQQKSDEDHWWEIQRAGILDAPYWDERRKLLDVPRSQGGFKADA